MGEFIRRVPRPCEPLVSTWQPPSGQNPQPYAPSGHFAYQPPPPKSSSAWIWVLLGLGGALFLCCGGGVVAVGMFGMNIVAAEVEEQLRDNPKLREHIGEIQSLEFDFVATAAKDDDETFVYNVQGDKGSGTLTVRQTTDEELNEVIEQATLRLKDGKTVEIVP